MLKRSQHAIANGFADRVDAALGRRTMKWLSEKTGISASMLSDYRKGKTPGADKALAIAEVLDADLRWLLTGSGSAVADSQLAHRSAGSDLDSVSIDSIDLRYGMGGTFVDIGEVEVDQASFSRAWLRKFTHSPPEMLFTTSGVGDSMEPTINDHDVVIIDRSERTLKDALGEKIWALTFGNVGMIKRLRPMPDGTVKLMSDNQSVRDEIATDQELRIVGRVVAVVRRQ